MLANERQQSQTPPLRPTGDRKDMKSFNVYWNVMKEISSTGGRLLAIRSRVGGGVGHVSREA